MIIIIVTIIVVMMIIKNASYELLIIDFGCLPYLVGVDIGYKSCWVHEMKQEQTTNWLYFGVLYCTSA